MATTFITIYDANVLYSAPLHNLLMRLALEDILLARWTRKIYDDWICNVLENRKDLRREQLERTSDLMNGHVHDNYVTDYTDLIHSSLIFFVE